MYYCKWKCIRSYITWFRAIPLVSKQGLQLVVSLQCLNSGRSNRRHDSLATGMPDELYIRENSVEACDEGTAVCRLSKRIEQHCKGIWCIGSKWHHFRAAVCRIHQEPRCPHWLEFIRVYECCDVLMLPVSKEAIQSESSDVSQPYSVIGKARWQTPFHFQNVTTHRN